MVNFQIEPDTLGLLGVYIFTEPVNNVFIESMLEYINMYVCIYIYIYIYVYILHKLLRSQEIFLQYTKPVCEDMD